MNKNTLSILAIVLLAVVAFGVLFYIAPKKSPISSVDIEGPELTLKKPTENKPVVTQTPTIPKEEKVVAQQPAQNEEKKSIKASALETQMPEQYIAYENGVFTPNNINISKNTKVIFTNKGPGNMQIASTPYPTASNYPEFHQKRAVPIGGTYSFVFLNEGAFNFLNYSNLSAKGTIYVK
jgi:plastocyanin